MRPHVSSNLVCAPKTLGTVRRVGPERERPINHTALPPEKQADGFEQRNFINWRGSAFPQRRGCAGRVACSQKSHTGQDGARGAVPRQSPAEPPGSSGSVVQTPQMMKTPRRAR